MLTGADSNHSTSKSCGSQNPAPELLTQGPVWVTLHPRVEEPNPTVAWQDDLLPMFCLPSVPRRLIQKSLTLLLSLTALLLVTQVAVADNILVNPSFEGNAGHTIP